MAEHAKEFVSKVSGPNGHGILCFNSIQSKEWMFGAVPTRWGYVTVQAEGKFASLRIIHDGYAVNRTYRRSFTKRGLVTLANRFAEEICG